MCGGNSIIAEYLISMKSNNQSYNKIACYMNKEWIPYSKIDNLEIIAEGGLGTIYKATCSNNFVAVKRFSNSKDISRRFLNEINSLHRCYNTAFIVKYYAILCQISDGLKTIHNENFVHRNFHSGNILSLKGHKKWLGPQFTEKHPDAIYTSRSLNSFISQLLNRPQHDKWDSSDWDV
ncbi:unnamed protein product [Rhizophagus irregularis]|nr:unnamed protein product [Rhizophagus irregularis]